MQMSNKVKRQRRIAYSIFAIGLILLLLANALAWLFLLQISGFFVSDLAFRLENIAQISSKLIDPTDLMYLIPDDQSDPAMIHYQQLLAEVRKNNKLQDIYILSPAREILIEIPGDFGEAITRHDLEPYLFQQAIGGTPATSPLQTLGHHKFMTSLAPITDPNNMVAAIVVVEAPAEFFDLLERFNNGIMIFSGVSIMVIVIVALLLWRAFHRLVAIQEQMQDQEHLAKLGEMAATIAHEIRNPLSIIKGTNNLIEKKYGNPDDEFFQYIPAELARLDRLIEDFLSFARTRDPQITEVNLADLVQKVKIGFDRSPDVMFRIVIAENAKTLKTDAAMLEQILLNIITNSQQAISGEGKIEISAIAENNALRITIKDNGSGIDPVNAEHIFEPFFSTKDSGSGLGLAISRRLAERLKGSLSVTSEPGRGTTVSLYLPRDWERG